MTPIQKTSSSPRTAVPSSQQVAPSASPVAGAEDSLTLAPRGPQWAGAPTRGLTPPAHAKPSTQASPSLPPAPAGAVPGDWAALEGVVAATQTEFAQLRALPQAQRTPAQAQRYKLLNAYHSWHSAKELPEAVRLEAAQLRVRQIQGPALSRTETLRLEALGEQRAEATMNTTVGMVQGLPDDLAAMLKGLLG